MQTAHRKYVQYPPKQAAPSKAIYERYRVKNWDDIYCKLILQSISLKQLLPAEEAQKALVVTESLIELLTKEEGEAA